MPLSSGKRLSVTCGVQQPEVFWTDGWDLGCMQSFITCVICAPGVAGAGAGLCWFESGSFMWVISSPFKLPQGSITDVKLPLWEHKPVTSCQQL